MRRVPFLFLFLLCSQFLFGYTVVLRSGKKIEGKLVAEDSVTIQIKGVDGISLSFKKNILDLPAMARLNETASASSTPAIQQSDAKPGLAEIARISRMNRTGKARLLTQNDLAEMPEISIIGSDNVPLQIESRPTGSMPSKEERYWRSAAASLKRKLEAVGERKTTSESACLRARDSVSIKTHRKAVSIISLTDPPRECEKVEELKRQLQQIESEWSDFQDRARRAEVPWQWIE